MDLNNLTFSVGDHNYTTGKGFSFFSVFGAINVVWIVVINLLLLISLLSSAALRRQLRVQLIVCMAICDLTTGVLSTGFFTYAAFAKFWSLGCPFHYLVQLLGVFADIFLTTWYLVVFDATFFMDLMQINLPKLSPLGDKLFRVLVMITPVLLFCIVALPLIFSHPGDVRPTNAEFCPLFLENTYEIVMSFVVFFIPATSVVIFCFTFIVFRNERTVTREVLARNLLEEPTMVERPLYFLLPSLSVVLMALPEQVLSTLYFAKLIKPSSITWLFMTFGAMEVMRQGVLPLTWLIFPDIRQAFKDRLSCKICNAKAEMTVTNFSYTNLQND